MSTPGLTNFENVNQYQIMKRLSCRVSVYYIILLRKYFTVNNYLTKVGCYITYCSGLIQVLFRTYCSGLLVAENEKLPFNMVQVSGYTLSSDSVQLPIVHQAVVSAAWDSHSGHQVPVVQEGHITPHICHRHPRLCTT